MKRRLMVLMGVLVMAVSLTACAKNRTSDDYRDKDRNKDRETVVSASVDDNSSKTSDTSVDTLTGKGEDTETDFVYDFLLSHTYGSVVLLDADGAVVKSISVDRDEYNPVTVFGKYLLAVKTDMENMYLNDDSYNEECTSLVAIDIFTGETKEIYSGNISYVDAYNRKLYLYSDSFSGNNFKEHVFEYGSFKDITETNYYIDGLGDFSLVAPVISGYSNRKSVQRILDETGYLIVTREGEYFSYDGDGFVKIEDIGDNMYLRTYDDGFAILTGYEDGAYDKQCIYILDFNTSGLIMLGYDIESFIGTNGKEYYYCAKDGGEYGQEVTLVFVGTLGGTVDLVLTPQKRPGFEYCVYEGFKKIGDRVYFVTFNNGVMSWAGATQEGPIDLGIKVYETEFAKYGEIKAFSSSIYCDTCYNIVLKNYSEYLELKGDYSQYASKINDYLEKRAFSVVDADENVSTADIEECHEMGHGEPWGVESMESTISSIYVLYDRYLVVNFSGYWYGGGAHGMASFSEEMFDLYTGDVVEPKDFIGISEEEFKSLVATKAKALCEEYSGDYMSPFYDEESPEDIYGEAYEFASFESMNIVFTEDGKVVAEFPPYILGPYSSGYIEIALTYDELKVTGL